MGRLARDLDLTVLRICMYGDFVGVRFICGARSTWDAFAGIRSDGSVVTWGSPIGGGAVPSSVKHRLKEVIHVQAG